MMRQVAKVKSPLLRDQRGISLLESLAAVAIFAVIGVIFLSALMTISNNNRIYEERVTASVLALSKMELIKAAPYDGTAPYYDTVAEPGGKPPAYNITVSATIVGGVQEITVSVSWNTQFLYKLKMSRFVL
jgi:Tfp pilus assembly protein PilV